MSLFNRRGGNEGQPPGSGGPGFNSGVQNSGTMGNVQNQPGASNSRQHQVNTSDPAAQARLAESLDALDAALTRERDLLSDPDRCRILFDTVRDLDLTYEGDRTAARSMLGRIAANCGGAANVATLAAGTLTILNTVTG